MPWLLAACTAGAAGAEPVAEPAAAAGTGPGLAALAHLPAGLRPFCGRYAGTLRMHGPARVAEVPMQLVIEPLPPAASAGAAAACARFVLVYGQGEAAQVRDYRVLVRDAVRGDYAIDEQNGIVLPTRLVDGDLVSIFQVQGQLLVVRYSLRPEGIGFAIESFAAGAAVDAGQGVGAWSVVTSQRAVLRRSPD